MPLQHSHEHEHQPTPRTPLAPSPLLETLPEAALQSDAVPDAPRYDAATVRQLLALAEQMQTHHDRTLSRNEVEELGHERGIDPAFVRRALAQQAEQQAEQPVHRKRKGKRQKAVRPSLNALASGPLWYLLAMSATLPWLFINDPISHWFYLYLPLALAFGVGFAKKRSAGSYGLWFGMAGLLAILTNGLVHHWAAPGMDVFLVMLTIWLGGCSFMGMMGGVVRGIVDRAKTTEATKTQNSPGTE